MMKIVLIGAGNVAFHLGKKLHEVGFEIVQIYSRTEKKAKRLAKEINTPFTTDLKKISNNAQIYILAIHDDAIELVAKKLSTKKLKTKLFVHTSGSTPTSILKPYFENYGSFYPLQTFSISRKADFQRIPICIDSSRKKNRIVLQNIGEKISEQVFHIKDKERAILHVAAVFVCNLTNHLYAVGETILEKEKLPFDLLRPLILETALKVQENSPAQMQTGPAARGDQNTISRHLDYLEKHPDFAKIYMQLSKSIERKNS